MRAKQNEDMECWRSGLRFFMFALSGVLFVAGSVGLVAGVWMRVSPSSFIVPGGGGGGGGGGVLDGWTSVDLDPLSYLLMAAGLGSAPLGLLGCGAAARDSRCLRMTFPVAATMAVAAQAAGLAVALRLPGEMAGLLGPKALELMEENRVLALGVVGGVMALEALSAASSVGLYCISERRN